MIRYIFVIFLVSIATYAEESQISQIRNQNSQLAQEQEAQKKKMAEELYKIELKKKQIDMVYDKEKSRLKSKYQ